MRAVLIAALAACVCALWASAQTPPPDPPGLCNTWRTQWGDISAGSEAAPMRAFLGRVPPTCRQLRGQIERFIAARFPAPPITPPATTTRPSPATTTRPPAASTTSPPATTTTWRDGQRFRDCADCPEMVVIPAGSFTMGSPASETGRDNDEGPQRRITFARAFAVGRFEVTRGQYGAFVRATGRADSGNCYTLNASGSWEQTASATWRNPGFTQGEDHPVVCVSWEDARAYVAWLNTQTRGGYRLLSEAEWEYAARAGTTTPFVWGSDANAGCAFANGADATARARYSSWTWASTCNDGALNTAAAGSYRANAFGLSDMIGNAWEWTTDCYVESLDSVPSNGSANETGPCSVRVFRGGSWNNYPQSLRSANRNWDTPAYRYYNLGFRVARTLN